ncbi:C39 family peptidase [Corynebacterium sp. zg-331]|uniref:C39 family peptidase n=1 Tax=unclassified Corynebacterium TaxID=2624378 RepID=UPI00128E85D7|nr:MULTISPECIES: C39 family peptidase [unclassified Corynebacterium]MBC3185771.1 C39 family peptidase [Corynebacterium sp. zg-331]MPV52264.1 hypothetical protein [Corynebacterium sp. zg331]
MIPYFKHALTASTLVATMAAGLFAGVAQAQPSASAIDEVQVTTSATDDYLAGQYQFKYIRQNQGQKTRRVDCGPASILMALLDNGGQIPDSYKERNQAAAMTELRGEAPSGTSGGLHDFDIVSILENRGVSGTVLDRGEAIKAIDKLKEGKKAVVLTRSNLMRGREADGAFGHFVYVSGYDSGSNTFTVNDPQDMDQQPYQVTEDKMRTILTSPAKGNSEWVYVI